MLATRRFCLFALAVGLSGCALTRPTLAPGQSFPVFFTNASAVLDDPGRGVVDQAAAWARRYPAEHIAVTGYADPRAAEPIIRSLATRRADEVAALLEEKGVAPERIKRAIGDEALIGTSGLANRRVDIAVGL